MSENRTRINNTPEPEETEIFYTPPVSQQTNTSKKSNKNKLPAYRIAINVSASVLCAAVAFIGVSMIVMFSYFHRINYQNINVESGPIVNYTIPDASGTENNDEGLKSTYSGALLNDPMVLNVMLFGEDTREGSSAGNSDTMIIMSIDTRHKKIKMLSLLRDTYVYIPGYGENRLNAAYTLGGAALSVDTVQRNYGIKIDRYAVVDFGSFKNIINTLGGIDVEMTSEEVDYINWQTWINKQPEYKNADYSIKESVRARLRRVWLSSVPEEDKPINKNTLSFTEKEEGRDPTALVHLDGRQSLWHARNRGENGICSGNDYTRTDRQRQVINIIIKKLKSAGMNTALSVIYEIGPLVTTNIRTSEITSLSKDISTYLSYDIVSKSAPLADEIGTVYSFSGGSRPIYIGGYEASVILINNWNTFRADTARFIFEEQLTRN